MTAVSTPTADAERFRPAVGSASTPLIVAGLLLPFVGAILFTAWSFGRLPASVLALAAALTILGLAAVVAARVQAARRRWVLWVGPEGLTVTRRGQSQRISWPAVHTVKLTRERLTVLGHGGDRVLALPLGAGSPADDTLTRLRSAIDARLINER